MSKQIYTVTAEVVISMVEEIHEEVTAVTMQSIGDVHTMILHSVAEDAEIECDIVAVITQWVSDNTEIETTQGTGFEAMSAEELREYAETVQSEYEAGIITGAMGRTTVRHAWERVAEGEATEGVMGFTAKIRTAAEIAEIDAAVRIASQIAEQMSAEQLEVMVTSYDEMAKTIGTDAAIAMAMTFRKYAGK